MGVHQSEEVYSQIKDLLDIPAEEPIFILRAQDKFSLETIADYLYNVVNSTPIGDKNMETWYDNVKSVGQKFLNWQRENRDKVKVPD